MRRRDLLIGSAGTAAVLALAGLPACVSNARQAGTPVRSGETDARLADMLERHALSLRSAWADENDLVGDRSLAARARALADNSDRVAELAMLDRAELSPAAQLDFDTASFVYSVLGDQLARAGTVDLNLRPSPYVVSQMNGAYYWLPSRIGARAANAGPEGSENYLASIASLARGIDQESERVLHDASSGVIPPDFVLLATMAQVRALRDSTPAANPLLAPALALEDDDLAARARDRFTRFVVPALERQVEVLESLVPRANNVPGVWAQPDGEANYASSLRANTTTSHAPGELHRTGLEWVRSISDRIDRELTSLGIRSGTVGERIVALNTDPRFMPPDSDAGRAEVLRQAEALVGNARRRLPKAFARVVDDPVAVRRMPLTSEDSSPIAFYNGGQGGGPGTILLNLKRPGDLPSWRLPTLVHHEGVPGHHTQAAVLQDMEDLSLFRRTVRFSAWTEGWALYAEQLADEIGAYEDDPFGRIGYLQAQLWRAARVVVDTGIHHERWSRDRAVAFMIDEVGEPRVPTEREVDRYCVYPGQACCFMVGKQQIVASREAARETMGARFDLRTYNDLVLGSGPLPMEVMDARVRRWSLA